jgi:peptide chain release factor 2
MKSVNSLIKFWRVFDVDNKKILLKDLLKKSTMSSFWNNQKVAKTTMQEINEIELMVNKVDELINISADIRSAFELIDDSADANGILLEEVQSMMKTYKSEVTKLQLSIVFQDEYDYSNAVVSLHSGAGGTEAQDWAEMLLRMYLRWANNNNFMTEILSINASDEAGIKSVQFEVKGEKAYGLLKAEKGVHRLVRISPFDASHSRHTSFALVEVMPEANSEEDEILINQDDLRIDTYRASGHGGQSVQKNDTAVRITHLPSGIVVTCQNERSQARNRETALMVLKSRLLKIKLEEKEKIMLQERGEHVVAGWGNQIRSYVLHPYKLVKDLRTKHETSNVDDVLDGDIDEFIKLYLLKNKE